MAVSIEEDRGIAILSGPMVHANAADQTRGHRRLASDAESCVGHAARVKGADTDQYRETTPHVVRSHSCDEASVLIANEPMTADRCEARTPEDLEEHAFGDGPPVQSSPRRQTE